VLLGQAQGATAGNKPIRGRRLFFSSWVLLSIALTLIAILGTTGVSVTLHNQGDKFISESTVVYADHSFRFGPIKPGLATTGTVRVYRPSPISVEFVLDEGEPAQVDAGVVLWPLSRGSLVLTVSDGGVSVHPDSWVFPPPR